MVATTLPGYWQAPVSDDVDEVEFEHLPVVIDGNHRCWAFKSTLALLWHHSSSVFVSLRDALGPQPDTRRLGERKPAYRRLKSTFRLRLSPFANSLRPLRI